MRVTAMLSLALLMCTQIACATMGFTSDTDKLLKTASFDHDCPREKVRVINSQEDGLGAASFKLDVCGTPKRYKRMGTVFFDAEKGDLPGSR
jgi:hypothetical protein